MSDILSLISSLFIPAMVFVIIIFGLIKKAPLYDLFIEGAKEGIKTAVDILPFVIGIFIAIEVFTDSGALEFVVKRLTPLCDLLRVPRDVLSLILLRPVSGSGSLILTNEIMKGCGPDSISGRTAAVMTGSCETVFYVLALYFGVTSVKDMRHAFVAGLAGYISATAAAIFLCKFI